MVNERQTDFAQWLRERVQPPYSVRGLARDIAANHSGGATTRNVETTRRALNKYIHEGRMPSPPMRRAIADALGVNESVLPEDGDEEADMVEALVCDPDFRDALRSAAILLDGVGRVIGTLELTLDGATDAPCGDPRPDPRTHPEYWTE